MCRLFATSGDIGEENLSLALREFKELARSGRVPIGAAPGHGDGWGMVGFKGGSQVFLAKRPHNAYYDPLFEDATKQLVREHPESIVVHFRKKIVGDATLENTHPFVNDDFVFWHNGSIIGDSKLPLNEEYRKLVKGQTDTEKFFYFFLQNLGTKNPLPSQVRQAIQNSLDYVRKNLDYTAINLLFSNGKHSWAMREFNENNNSVKEYDLKYYYTLFVGTLGHEYIICSEKINVPKVHWRLMDNHELLEFDETKKTVNSFEV